MDKNPDLQHVHHFLQLSRFNSRGVLHGEAFEILNQDKSIDLGLLILQ